MDNVQLLQLAYRLGCRLDCAVLTSVYLVYLSRASSSPEWENNVHMLLISPSLRSFRSWQFKDYTDAPVIQERQIELADSWRGEDCLLKTNTVAARVKVTWGFDFPAENECHLTCPGNMMTFIFNTILLNPFLSPVTASGLTASYETKITA